MRNNKKGISIVALTVALVVMSVLATVTVMSLDNTEMINNSKENVKIYNKANMQERLEVLKNTYITDNFGNITVMGFVEYLVENGEIYEDYFGNIDGTTTINTINDYVATLIQDGEDNIIIDVEGIKSSDKPRISILKVSTLDKKITVDIELEKGVYVEYIYSYKLSTETEYRVVNTDATKLRRTVIDSLEPGTYNIKITATNTEGDYEAFTTITVE